MEINFYHPRTSVAFKADVDLDTTGRKCIDGLIEAKFIDEPPSGQRYDLVVTRTQKQVLPEMSMQDAGVLAGDSLAVLQPERGA